MQDFDFGLEVFPESEVEVLHLKCSVGQAMKVGGL